MGFGRIILRVTAVIFFAGGTLRAQELSSPEAIAWAAVSVPDSTHAGEPLPDGVLAWDDLLKVVDATNGQDFARFSFTFTNLTPTDVTVLGVHPSCGCTTAEMPATPWLIPPGSNGVIKLRVNLAGKNGTVVKTANVTTDQGQKVLTLRINILPPPAARENMTEDERARAVAAAQIDRQIVFRGECAACHNKDLQTKTGKALYDSACGICHEAEHRASMVPDLHKLTVPTNEDFWRTAITLGKPGSLMPAFSTNQGGPLNDLQIAALAAWLNSAVPSRATNASTP